MANESYDVVIVGAGTGGLNVGSLLATGGKRVLVLEQQGEVGGRAISTRYKNCVSENGIHGLILSGHQDEVYRRVGKTLPPNVNKWTGSQIYMDGEWRNFGSHPGSRSCSVPVPRRRHWTVELREPPPRRGKTHRSCHLPSETLQFLLYRTWGNPLMLLSIGENCRTHFPIRSEFFHPGICPRAGQVASS
jgi:choline dehydrogenase-like flavoprotein